MPGLLDRASKPMAKSQYEKEPRQPHKNSLWEAGDDGQVYGRKSSGRPSTYTAARVHPGAALATVAALSSRRIAEESDSQKSRFPEKRLFHVF